MSYDKGIPRDPIESATRGVTKGTLDWTTEKIKELVTRFKDKELVFIKDYDTIETAKEQRKKGEWSFFVKYISDKKLHVLFQMGLTLRKLEKESDNTALKSLIQKIRDVHGRDGLHIAYFVQNGLFSKYVGVILEKGSTERAVKREIEQLFMNLNKIVAYVEKNDTIIQKANSIITKIQSNSPETFIMSSCRKQAMDICKKIMARVLKQVSNEYTVESYLSMDKLIYFFNRKEDSI